MSVSGWDADMRNGECEESCECSRRPERACASHEGIKRTRTTTRSVALLMQTVVDARTRTSQTTRRRSLFTTTHLARNNDGGTRR